jgi:DnaJ domain
MKPVPRRSQRAAEQEGNAQVNGTVDTATDEVASDDTALLPILAADAPLALPAAGPELKIDPGLYAVLGLDPSVSDAEIQTTYRRQAARLMGSGSYETQVLKQLNVAYEVLGNPLRRAEYDRLRLTQNLAPRETTPIRSGLKTATRVTRRRRPRHAVQPRYAGMGDVLVVLTVVGLAVLAGALIIPRVSINLSALNALQSVLPLSNVSRRVIDTTPTAATAVPTATPLPSIAALFTGSSVSVSDPTPAQNAPENVTIRLRRDGKPAPNFPVWATVQYRTTQERWPATGSLTTDANGAATITFNIGGATPNYPVAVHVFAQVEDQQLSWSTSFTPR